MSESRLEKPVVSVIVEGITNPESLGKRSTRLRRYDSKIFLSNRSRSL